MACLQVSGQGWLRGECLGVEAGGGVALAVVLAQLGEAEEFGGIFRAVLAGQDSTEAVIEPGRMLGVAEPQERGIGPIGAADAELMTAAECLDGLIELPLLHKNMTVGKFLLGSAARPGDS
jgi:hypothetical protein